MVASFFLEHRYVGGCARKYKGFDVAHASSLLSYLSNVIKRHKALVIIGVHFL